MSDSRLINSTISGPLEIEGTQRTRHAAKQLVVLQRHRGTEAAASSGTNPPPLPQILVVQRQLQAKPISHVFQDPDAVLFVKV